MPDHIPVPLPDGVRLHAESVGPEAAPVTLVLLHGWTLDRRTWHRQVRSLTETFGDTVRVVSYDARGHGHSGCAPLCTATLPELSNARWRVVAPVPPVGVRYAHLPCRSPLRCRRISWRISAGTSSAGPRGR